MDRTVLLVDDNDEERRIYATYLRFVGGQVLEARDGAEAVEQARAHRPDLILMDLRMPGVDGWEAVARLAKDPRTAYIPVLALTATRVARERLTRAGFCGYLEKPLAPYRVMTEVERCIGPLEKRRAERMRAPRPRDPVLRSRRGVG